ncbi:MAG TPA: hypothetical protein VJB35_06150 [Candidatus Nanoarchaeia archaeon]|nr:hypothetical protein [Candidatus Nanoarchaeia archaeon]
MINSNQNLETENNIPNFIYLSLGIFFGIIFICYNLFLIVTPAPYTNTIILFGLLKGMAGLLFFYLPNLILLFITIFLFLFGIKKLQPNKRSDLSIKIFIFGIILIIIPNIMVFTSPGSGENMILALPVVLGVICQVISLEYFILGVVKAISNKRSLDMQEGHSDL